MSIYLDVYFFINFLTDYIILTIAFGGNFLKIFRKLAASLLGAIYSCLFVLDTPDILFCFPLKLCVLGIMCATVCLPCSIKKFFNAFFAVFFTSLFVCGSVYGLQCLFSGGNMPVVGIGVNDVVLSLGIFLGYVLSKLCFSYFKKQSMQNSRKIKIYYREKSVSAYAIIDTGNSLKEPISGCPVIIADEKILKKLLGEAVCAANLCEFVNPEDFRVIPYKTISGSGIIQGFIPEKIELANRDIENAVVAAAPIHIEADILLNPLLV